MRKIHIGHFDMLLQYDIVKEKLIPSLVPLATYFKVRGPFVEKFCIEKDSYIDGI